MKSNENSTIKSNDMKISDGLQRSSLKDQNLIKTNKKKTASNSACNIDMLDLDKNWENDLEMVKLVNLFLI